MEKIYKTMTITHKNGLSQWKRFYIMMIYGLPYINYGANAFLTTSKNKILIKDKSIVEL